MRPVFQHGLIGELLIHAGSIDNEILTLGGVLLDCNLAYASVWLQAFGVYPRERNPHAYWALYRWDIELLDGVWLVQFRENFNERFWEGLPVLPGATQACKDLTSAGYLLVCVSALSEQFAKACQRNLKRLGLPIEVVIATGKVAEGRSPKADALHRLRPIALVDDYLPYMAGIRPCIHRALVTRDPNGSPNTGDSLLSVSSKHNNLREFSDG